jgi:hypothetical protein
MSSPRTTELVQVNEYKENKNNLGQNILDFIISSAKSGQTTAENIAIDIKQNLDRFMSGNMLRDIASVEQITPLETMYADLIFKFPEEKKNLELKKAYVDAFYALKPASGLISPDEENKVIYNARMVQQSVENNYDKIDIRLNRNQRLRVITNAVSAAVKYIKNNPSIININYDIVNLIVHSAIIFYVNLFLFSAQFKNKGGRKKSTKRRQRRPRRSRTPRYLRNPRHPRTPRYLRNPRRSRKPKRN